MANENEKEVGEGWDRRNNQREEKRNLGNSLPGAPSFSPILVPLS